MEIVRQILCDRGTFSATLFNNFWRSNLLPDKLDWIRFRLEEYVRVCSFNEIKILTVQTKITSPMKQTITKIPSLYWYVNYSVCHTFIHFCKIYLVLIRICHWKLWNNWKEKIFKTNQHTNDVKEQARTECNNDFMGKKYKIFGQESCQAKY